MDPLIVYSVTTITIILSTIYLQHCNNSYSDKYQCADNGHLMDEQLTNNMTFVPHSQFRRPSSNKKGVLIQNIILFTQDRLLKAWCESSFTVGFDQVKVVNSSLGFLAERAFHIVFAL